LKLRPSHKRLRTSMTTEQNAEQSAADKVVMEKRRILIIDDEPSFTRMVRLNLEKTGMYEVREENRATGAVNTARDFKPSIPHATLSRT
jgi:PleD family two-component response regulator